MNLIDAVEEYILAKMKMTECMQKHFRQVCHNCSNYSKCNQYNMYVEAWVNLQKTYLEEIGKT